MNLKEAFRYQNKLQRLMTEAEGILMRDNNVTKVENTALRHKVNPEAEDETTLEMPETEYAEQITEVAVFLMFLLGERERLSTAIRAAKQSMDMDFDGEVSLNIECKNQANSKNDNRKQASCMPQEAHFHRMSRLFSLSRKVSTSSLAVASSTSYSFRTALTICFASVAEGSRSQIKAPTSVKINNPLDS